MRISEGSCRGDERASRMSKNNRTHGKESGAMIFNDDRNTVTKKNHLIAIHKRDHKITKQTFFRGAIETGDMNYWINLFFPDGTMFSICYKDKEIRDADYEKVKIELDASE
jgi:hypothetical protein